MPDWNEPIRKQLADLNLAPAREAEIVEELAQHAGDRYRELQSGGATEAEARRIAHRRATAGSAAVARRTPQEAALQDYPPLHQAISQALLNLGASALSAALR